MAIDEKKVADLETRLGNLEKGQAETTEAIKGIGTTIANAIADAMKPLSTSVEALTNAQKAADEAAKAVLVNKIVEAGVLSKEAAEASSTVVLNELAGKIKPGKAAQLNASLPNNQSVEDEFKDYDLNAIVNVGTKKEAA